MGKLKVDTDKKEITVVTDDYQPECIDDSTIYFI